MSYGNILVLGFDGSHEQALSLWCRPSNSTSAKKIITIKKVLLGNPKERWMLCFYFTSFQTFNSSTKNSIEKFQSVKA